MQALDDVDFEVNAGEVVALVGDNGAGKSTLVKVISGIYAARQRGGLVRRPAGLAGQPVRGDEARASPPSTRTWRCATTSTWSRTCSSAARCAARLGVVTRGLDETKMEQRSHELLSNLAVTIPSVRSEVGTLSGGQRQPVAVARSLLGDPKVVLLDEPTAALGVAQTAQVLALVKRLREQGLGVMVISHNLADVFEVADRIVVLRLGKVAGLFNVRDTTQEEIVGAITGAEFGRSQGNGGPAEVPA